jgi:hypothetical protein
MVKNILLGFASLALAVAGAATSSYNVTFYQPVMINGSELKAGDYQLELNDTTAVIKQGGTVTEAPVTVHSGGQKYQQNIVRLNHRQVEEIRIGGTSTRVVFEKASNGTKTSSATKASNATN